MLPCMHSQSKVKAEILETETECIHGILGVSLYALQVRR